MTDIELNEGWDWVPAPWGRGLQCRPLARVAAHVFTTRLPDLGHSTSSADPGWCQIASSLGVSAAALVRLRQIHGRTVVLVSGQDGPPPAGEAWGDGDAAVTARGDVALSVRVADCVPALVADRTTGAVAAVHAGWRGTCAGVAVAVVESLRSVFGTDPAHLVAAIGPSIGPCCYRVGAEVEDAFTGVEAWRPHLARWVMPAPARSAKRGVPGADPGTAGRPSRFLDTWTANADQFAAAGVPRSQIHVSGLCTSCYREVFHSYRVDGPEAGRMVGAIRSTSRDQGSETGDR